MQIPKILQKNFNSDTKGDVEKARTFVESDKEFNKLNEKTDDAEAKAMISAITKNFKFEKLEEVSKRMTKQK